MIDATYREQRAANVIKLDSTHSACLFVAAVLGSMLFQACASGDIKKMVITDTATS